MDNHIDELLDALINSLDCTHQLLCSRVLTREDAVEDLRIKLTDWADKVNNAVEPVFANAGVSDKMFICNY